MAVMKLVRVISASGDEAVLINPDAIATVYPKKAGTSDRPSATIHMVNGHKVMIDEASYHLFEVMGAETS